MFNEGIYEQIKTVDAGKEITDSSAAWADSSTNSANTQTAAQQLANEWSGEVAPTWSSNDETRKLKDITNIEDALGVDAGATAQEIAQAIENKVEEAGKTAEEAEAASALKGSGTQADPFLVYDYATMQKITDFYNLGYYYFEVALDKTDNGTIDCTDWESVKLNGSFNGNGVKFINLDWRLFSNIKGNELSHIHDFDIYSCYIVGDYSSALCNNVLADHVLIENVNITGYIEGNSWAASYISYAGDYGKKMTLTFKNCESSAVLVSASSCAGFIAHPGNIGEYVDSRIEIIDSKFNGTISHSGTNAYYISYCYVTQKVLYFKYNENYDYSGLYTLGSPSSLSEKDVNGFQHYNNTVNNGFDSGGIKYTKENSVVQLVQQNVTRPEKYESFSIEALSSTTKATFIWTIGYTASTGGTNWTAGYIKETVDKDSNGYVTSTFKYYDLTLNGSSTTSTGLASDGKTFNVVNPVYIGEPDSNFITITEYNSVGAVVRITKINLK